MTAVARGGRWPAAEFPGGPPAHRALSGIRAPALSPLHPSPLPRAPFIDTAPIIFKFQVRTAAA